MNRIGAYVARETVVSAVISAAISAGFFLGLFGLQDPAPIRGWTGYAFDFVPQSAPVAFMACMVPTLLARKAIATGRIHAAPAPLFPAALRLALTYALFGAALGGCLALMWIGSGVMALAPVTALLLKIGYGALLGAFVTWRVLNRLLRPPPAS